jgi:hypothetical protein
MIKVITYAALFLISVFVAFLTYRIWQGYQTGWVTIPTQAQIYLEFSPADRSKVLSALNQVAAEAALRETENRGDELTSFGGAALGLSWRYPVVAPGLTGIYGIVLIRHVGNLNEFADLIVAVQNSIATISSVRVVHVLLVQDARTSNCAASCEKVLLSPGSRETGSDTRTGVSGNRGQVFHYHIQFAMIEQSWQDPYDSNLRVRCIT